jgi:hypothetical protein
MGKLRVRWEGYTGLSVNSWSIMSTARQWFPNKALRSDGFFGGHLSFCLPESSIVRDRGFLQSVELVQRFIDFQSDYLVS